MPLSQMSDKVFGMIKSDMYAIKLQEKVRELSVLDTTNRQIRVICLTVAMPLSQMFDKGTLGVRYQCGKHSVNLRIVVGVRPQCGKHSVNLRENQS